MSTVSPEKGKLQMRPPEAGASLVVMQPPKVEMLLDALAAIDKISERIAEDRSGDMGSGGAGGGQKGDGSTAATVRDQKIASLPVPEVMRLTLQKEIEKEVTALQKEVRKATRRLGRPGAAHKLNLLYARIRRLNALIAEILDAAYDVLKRLFIKTIIDRQKVL